MRADSLSDFSPSDTMDALATMESSTTSAPVRSLVCSSLRPVSAALLILVLSGCSLLRETRQSIEQDIDTTSTLREQMRERSEPFAVLTHQRARIAGEEIRLKEEKEILPPLFNERVTYVTSGQTLQETLETVSRQVGMPIWLTEFVSDKESVGRNSSSSNDDDERGRVTIQIHYDGPLYGLLDQLAQSARLHWRYYEGRVEFFLYETRHFYVNLPMGSRTITSGISSSASGGGGEGGGSSGGTGSVGVEMEGMKIDPYNVITRAIAAILMEDDGQADVLGNGDSDIEVSELSSGGSSGNSSNDDAKRGASRMVVAPEMGMVTVTAQPTALDRVADYIEQINRRFSRNVVIDVKIYDVTIADDAGVGTALPEIGGILSRRIRGLGAVLTGGANGIGIVRDSGTMAIADPSTTMNALLTALRSFGRTSLVQSGQVMVVNGQPAPLQIATERSYISRVSTTPPSTGGGVVVPGTTTYDTDKISEGLTANFLPHMLADNRILLQYQLTSRTLVDLRPGPGGIQLPEISSQTVQQQAFVRDSEAIVLFGFGNDRSSANGEERLALNVNRNASQNRTLRVIVMQIFGGGPNGNAYM